MIQLQRRTVASQLTDLVRKNIAEGNWREWLPSERTLCDELHVSRDSLRIALKQLSAEKLITPRRGVGYRIEKGASRRRSPSVRRVVALLAPDLAQQIRPNDMLWIDELKVLLDSAGFELRLCHGQGFYRVKSGHALERLVQRQDASVWILLLASQPMLHWFGKNGIPCIVAGSGCDDCEQTTVDLDYRAICRHAAGALIRAGHRHIVLLNQRTYNAFGGSHAGEIGFMEATRQCRESLRAEVVCHDESPQSIRALVKRLFLRPDAPTGMIVAGSNWYASTLTALMSLGLDVPRDVSLISRDDDGFLDYLLPPPARYRKDPRMFAKKILAQVVRIAQQPSASAPEHIRIVPEFFAGASIASSKRPAISRASDT